VLEAWTALSAAGVVTRRASIGPFVLNVMNRHPAVVARMAGTLDELTGGRFRLGIGIGGHPREHEAYGIDFPPPAERVARLRDAVAVIRALWTGGPATLEGTHARLVDAWARPALVPPPPILVGAQTPGGVRLAAEIGDGWAAEAPAFEPLLPRYLEALAAAGKDRASQLVVLGFSGGRAGQDALAGSPFVEAPREAVEAWLAKGVDEVTVTARTTADVDALVAAADRW
jgi:alkanesulfonate monooxygenase SsuD/methylene tetrahydromethanopterin reductase-like flavin-dependent oxidoreductase (luciferase family)